MMRLLLFLILFLALVSAEAAVHVRAGASGDGSTWTAALAVLPATPTRGETYYISGNFPAYAGTTANSGTQTITVRAATVAEHGSATGWLDAYASTATFTTSDKNVPAFQVSTDYWNLNGAGRTGLRSGYGIKLATSVTASPPGNLGSTLLRLDGAGRHHINISYVEMLGPGGAVLCYGLYAVNGTLASPNYAISVHRCYAHTLNGVPWVAHATTITLSECITEAIHGTPEYHAEGVQFRSSTVTIKGCWWIDIGNTAILRSGGGDATMGATSGPWVVQDCVFDYNGSEQLCGNVLSFHDYDRNEAQEIIFTNYTGDVTFRRNIVTGMALKETTPGSGILTGNAGFDWGNRTGTITLEDNVWDNCEFVGFGYPMPSVTDTWHGRSYFQGVGFFDPAPVNFSPVTTVTDPGPKNGQQQSVNTSSAFVSSTPTASSDYRLTSAAQSFITAGRTYKLKLRR